MKVSQIISHTMSMCILSLGLIMYSNSMNAQRSYGELGVGAQIGQPTALSLKLYKPKASLDVMVAWDLDDFFFVNLHSIKDVHLNDQNTVHFYYGPGAFVGIRDRNELDDDVELGLSGMFGLDFIVGKFELFVQAVPRLQLVDSTNFDIGGGVGFRVYL